jgi:hypothetical protein
MAKAEQIISDICELLRKKQNRPEILANICENLRVSSRTFDKYWKIASEQYKETQQIIQKAVNDTLQAETIEAAKIGLKSKIEHQLEIQSEINELQDLVNKGYILKRIEVNEDKVLEKEEVFGSYEIAQINGVIDRKRKELFMLDGMYAPAKVAQTTKDGQDVPQGAFQVEIVKPATNEE